MVFVAQKKSISEFTTNEISNRAAEDRCACCRENHRGNVEIVLGCRVNRRSQEGSLARQGKAHAFDADNYGYYDQAINVNEMGNKIHGQGATFVEVSGSRY